MPTPRTGFAAAAMDGLIYFIGGMDHQYCPAACERYDPHIGKWESLPPMLKTCVHCSATAISGKLFVVALGKVGIPPNDLAVCECYDPTRCRWTAFSPPPLSECSAAVGALGRMYTISSLEWVCTCLDPCSAKWIDLPPICPTLTRSQACCEIVAGAATAGKVYFFGSHIDDICIFDICAQSWEMPSLSTWLPYTVKQSHTSCVVATSGKLYVFCTYEDKLRQRAVCGAAVLDPHAKIYWQWSLLPQCQVQRSGVFSAVVNT